MTIRRQNSIKIIKTILLSSYFIFFSLTAAFTVESRSVSIDFLDSVDIQNEKIQLIRQDIRKTIVLIKKRGEAENLPELKFFKYKVKPKENFWKILTKTSLNIDTLSTINALSSPLDIFPGKEIFIPNMRGIIYKVNKNDSIETISKKFNIDSVYISKVNKISNNNIYKEYLFIPSGETSNIERSLFLGVGFGSPLKNYIRTSSFGRRLDPFNKHSEFHTGLDLACPIGSNVYAARKGKAVFSGYNGGYGLLLILKHEHGYSTYYGHLKKVLIKAGDVVERGDIIAVSGDSGRSTGPHLHFEVRKESRPVNPGVLL
ncbi:MAG: LysM peptidoglycan-binding domain-containing M23 family metallopeptidase [Spirochaetota bacterium]